MLERGAAVVEPLRPPGGARSAYVWRRVEGGDCKSTSCVVCRSSVFVSFVRCFGGMVGLVRFFSLFRTTPPSRKEACSGDAWAGGFDGDACLPVPYSSVFCPRVARVSASCWSSHPTELPGPYKIAGLAGALFALLSVCTCTRPPRHVSGCFFAEHAGDLSVDVACCVLHLMGP